jgi:hypothetical protein
MMREFVYRIRFESRAGARRVTGWINHHNARREHTSINNMSPIE